MNKLFVSLNQRDSFVANEKSTYSLGKITLASKLRIMELTYKYQYGLEIIYHVNSSGNFEYIIINWINKKG